MSIAIMMEELFIAEATAHQIILNEISSGAKNSFQYIASAASKYQISTLALFSSVTTESNYYKEACNCGEFYQFLYHYSFTQLLF